ncbi:hypothetical protein R1sor_007106 [Riccia sorocarpa]|uniref:DUF659 domain-containing protein n=1 Tax=Riccia sorocarpa TaxID=122646 RepID=A0ABD3HTP9_9MARC
MKTENVEAGPSASDAGIPQPRDEAGKVYYKTLCRSSIPEIWESEDQMQILSFRDHSQHHSNPDLAQGSMEYNRALRDRSASRTPTSSLLGGPESAYGLSSLEPERRMPSKSDILYYYNMEQQREAYKKWARAVYELGLPFNIFTHKVFKEAYEFNKHLLGYVLPGPKKLSNDMLDDEFKEVKDRTEKLMFPPLGFSKVTLTCDGWTNMQGRPIVNFLIVNKYGEMHHSSVDCSGIYKDATWESGELIKLIEELRPENVL